MIGRTLGLYLGSRFVKSVAVVFFTIFGLIYMVDFVEMLRRAGDNPNASAAMIAGLSLLRTPAVSEQVLPFAVLFGAMFAFINLTRKLELVVARAAGVSVWQFLTPPLLAALANRTFRHRRLQSGVGADAPARRIRSKRIFSSRGSRTAASMWIRQKSKDGQSIMEAGASSDAGLTLAPVIGLCVRPEGTFPGARRRRTGPADRKRVAALPCVDYRAGSRSAFARYLPPCD